MGVRVAAMGQLVAGDDGVGLAVLEELGRRPVPDGTALVPLADAVELISLLETADPVILVDAVLGAPSGLVIDRPPQVFSRRAAQPSSSHGMGAARAIELARTLSPRGAAASLRVVAVTISRPERYRPGLSPEVAAAVPQAADHVLRLLGG